uniref:G_PROTEIN_RECEP_F1_2 domain-containing protein n=1 Tax=Panagrellus redivivus TaxID=6233 RepID=A0A7E4V2C5_PANRE
MQQYDQYPMASYDYPPPSEWQSEQITYVAQPYDDAEYAQVPIVPMYNTEYVEEPIPKPETEIRPKRIRRRPKKNGYDYDDGRRPVGALPAVPDKRLFRPNGRDETREGILRRFVQHFRHRRANGALFFVTLMVVVMQKCKKKAACLYTLHSTHKAAKSAACACPLSVLSFRRGMNATNSFRGFDRLTCAIFRQPLGGHSGSIVAISFFLFNFLCLWVSARRVMAFDLIFSTCISTPIALRMALRRRRPSAATFLWMDLADKSQAVCCELLVSRCCFGCFETVINVAYKCILPITRPNVTIIIFSSTHPYSNPLRRPMKIVTTTAPAPCCLRDFSLIDLKRVSACNTRIIANFSPFLLYFHQMKSKT